VYRSRQSGFVRKVGSYCQSLYTHQ